MSIELWCGHQVPKSPLETELQVQVSAAGVKSCILARVPPSTVLTITMTGPCCHFFEVLDFGSASCHSFTEVGL
jgi:hypothetical protein